MEKREAMIADRIEHAQKEQEKALELKRRYEESLNGAKEESRKLIEQAKLDAKNEYDRIVSDADAKSGRMLQTARAAICAEREQTMRRMKAAKHRVIDRIFPAAVRSLLKVAADDGKIGYVPESIDVYRERMGRKAGIVAASLVYAEPPAGARLAKMEQVICRKCKSSGVRWKMREDKSLIGGFLLHVDGREYDYTVQGRLKRLEQKLTRR